MTGLTAANAHLHRLRQHVVAATAGGVSDLRLDAHAHLSNVVDLIRRTPSLTGAELSARLALTSFLTHLERESPPSQIEMHRRLTLSALDGLAGFLALPDSGERKPPRVHNLGNFNSVGDLHR